MSADRSAAAEAFWRFSLMFYTRPGIAEALIGLQDRAGHNVNLILFGLWLAVARGKKLDAARLARARAAMAKIDRDVVAPLRDLRRTLKDDPDPHVQDLRRRVLVLEVAAERHVQARLVATIAGRSAKSGRSAVVETNLRLVLGADFASREGDLLSEAAASL